MWVAVAIAGSALVSGGVSYMASKNAADAQSDAAASAASASNYATDKANYYQWLMYDTSRKDVAPWRQAGKKALNALWAKVQAGPGEYEESPGYKFRLDEGLKAIDRSAAARGGVLSGRAVKEATRFAEDYATGDYQNWLANYYASLTPYQSMSGVGQTTASQNATQANQVGANVASNIMTGGQTTANALLSAGNASASGYINQANAITGAVNSGVNNYLLWKYGLN